MKLASENSHAHPALNDLLVTAEARAAVTNPNENPGMFRSWAHCFSWLVIVAGLDFLLYEVVNAVKGLMR